jgi:quercetin dioxygenase-like cupin family protein
MPAVCQASRPGRLVAALLAAVLVLATGAAGAQEAAPKKPVATQEIFSGDKTAAGQPILLPSGPVRLVATTYDIAPGVALPVHRHPFPRYAYVLAGTLTVTDEERGEKTTYKPGDVIVEMVGRWHSGRNVGTDPVRLLVIDQVPDGTTGNTELRPGGQ